MLPITARDRTRALTIPARSPLSRVTEALSMATSAPRPMAIPTTPPAVFSRSTTAALSRGGAWASTSSMPSFAATASAVARLSPVSMTIRIPAAISACTAPGALALIGSAMAIIAARTPHPGAERD